MYYKFINNEYGNHIKIEVESVPNNDKELVVSMIGPNSTCTNRITKMEARTMMNLLNAFLKDNP